MNRLALFVGARLAIRARRRATLAVGVCVGIAVWALAMTSMFPGLVRAQSERRVARNDALLSLPATAVRFDEWQGRLVTRVVVGPSAGRAIWAELGAPHELEAGDALLSPGLAALTTAEPAVARRYDVRAVGTVPEHLLAYPRELVVVAAVREADVRAGSGGAAVGAVSPQVQALLSLASGTMLAPLALVVTSAVQLAERRRERAHMALARVGFDPRSLVLVAAAEAGVAVVLGGGLGIAAATATPGAIRSLLPPEAQWFDGEARPHLLPVLVTLVAACGLAAIVAGIRERSRHRGARGAVWATAFGAGLVLLALLAVGPHRIVAWRHAPRLGLAALVAALAGAAGSLRVIVGWFGGLLGRSESPALEIAAARIADDARGASRVASGVLFCVVTAGIVGSIVAAADGAIETPDTRSSTARLFVTSAEPPPPPVGKADRFQLVTMVVDQRSTGTPAALGGIVPDTAIALSCEPARRLLGVRGDCRSGALYRLASTSAATGPAEAIDGDAARSAARLPVAIGSFGDGSADGGPLPPTSSWRVPDGVLAPDANPPSSFAGARYLLATTNLDTPGAVRGERFVVADLVDDRAFAGAVDAVLRADPGATIESAALARAIAAEPGAGYRAWFRFAMWLVVLASTSFALVASAVGVTQERTRAAYLHLLGLPSALVRRAWIVTAIGPLLVALLVGIVVLLLGDIAYDRLSALPVAVDAWPYLLAGVVGITLSAATIAIGWLAIPSEPSIEELRPNAG